MPVPTCTVGNDGCPCGSDGTCSSGLSCQNGTCVANLGFTQPLPAHPICYTPCRTGYTKADGTYVACSADGLLEGCVGENTCVNGTCLNPAAMPRKQGLDSTTPCTVDSDCPGNSTGTAICVSGGCQSLCGVSNGSCGTDADCPEFQVCVQGSCYSNCQADSDCPSGAVCYLRACRLPCTATHPTCPAGRSCQNLSSTTGNGVCLPSPTASAPNTMVATGGSITLTSADAAAAPLTSIQFSNVTLTGKFQINNLSTTSQRITVKKLRHTEYTDTGTTTLVTTNPLTWLTMGSGNGTPQSVQSFDVELDALGGANSKAVITLAGANNPTLPRWNGVIEIGNSSVGRQRVYLGYRQDPAGQWSGRMYYFASFVDDGLSAWKADPTQTSGVKNAFMQQWFGFKRGDNFPLDRFNAMVQSTQTVSYEWPLMHQYCPESQRRCYPYNNAAGYVEYTSDTNIFHIPAGMVELPIAFNLTADMTRTGLPSGASAWKGEIVTDATLHYAGNPNVQMVIASNPTMCPTNVSGSTLCQLSDFQTQVSVGGRYHPDSNDMTCRNAPDSMHSSYKMWGTPWLIPGFVAGTIAGANGPVKPECRDTLLPYGSMRVEDNELLSISNPIPNGSTLHRTLSIVDGLLINQKTLVIIFQESVPLPSFLGAGQDPNFSGYGFMVLTRAAANLTAADYAGSDETDTRVQSNNSLLQATCSNDLVSAAFPGGMPVIPSQADWVRLARYVLGAPAGNPPFALPLNGEVPHYLCHDTGLFDGGHDNSSGSGTGGPVPCPAQSLVTFFTLTNYTGVNLRDLPCNQPYAQTTEPSSALDSGVSVNFGTVGPGIVIAQRGTCEDILGAIFPGGIIPRKDPVWQCSSPSHFQMTPDPCDVRTSLLQGKTFYAMPTLTQTPLLPQLDSAVDVAFQYRTRFRSRSGTDVGFAPVICAPGELYCYYPDKIEAARDRVDCMARIYADHYDALLTDSTILQTATSSLTLAFGSKTINTLDGGFYTKDGFERLFSELMVMLGDDSYTAAFTSRFDLANSRLHTFDGVGFEGSHGINLSGGAGFEMFSLYKSIQYYDLALERFFKLAPLILNPSVRQNAITNTTVTSYITRVIRASTQKAAALSEVAKHYQSFNQADLAKSVIVRAYTGAYLEGIIISNMLDKLRIMALSQNQPEIQKAQTDAAQRYRSTLLDMRDLYATITQNTTYFGFAPDYVPFPPLESGDNNAFEKILASARDKASTAAGKEEQALMSTTAYNSNLAAFQNELTRIQNDTNAQIGALCGTFVGDDGVTYPATAENAYLSANTKVLGDPCGLVGNGAISDAIGNARVAELSLEEAVKTQENQLASIKIEQQRLNDYCNLVDIQASYDYNQMNQEISLNRTIADKQANVHNLDDALNVAGQYASLIASCSSVEGCISSAAATAVYTVAATIEGISTAALSLEIPKDQQDLQDVQNSTLMTDTLRMCDYAAIDSLAQVKTMWLNLYTNDLEILKQQQQFNIAVSNVVQQKNQARVLIQQENEAQQLAIDTAAAIADPNSRIYKNDDILNADRTFNDAVAEAYKATKLYEYYTSQSYAHLDDLFLVRLVEHGNPSLESYLDQLSASYNSFQESFGNPDTRLAIISVRDDILRIPQLNAKTATPLCLADRVQFFRQALLDAKLIDNHGYIAIDFPTKLTQLSPITGDAKVLFIEAEFVGSDTGDDLGRIYLTQKGTGTVHSVVDGSNIFYGFPARTAVINTFFNGDQPYANTTSANVYLNDKLRDRPFVNTDWQVLVNVKDEQVNKDINLSSLSDIRLYVYYTDFTSSL
jgi:hypothetical protein